MHMCALLVAQGAKVVYTVLVQ